MKRTVMVKRYLGTVLVALPVVLMALTISCSKQDDGIFEQGFTAPVENVTYLKINSVSAGELSKAVIDGTSFPTDQDVSIGLFLEGEGYTDKYKNVKFTRKAGESEWKIDTIDNAGAAKAIVLNDKMATVYAYYPYNKSIDTIIVPVKSSIDSVDYMWATPIGNVNIINSDIDLTFTRVLALVEVTFNINLPGCEGWEMNNIRLESGYNAFAASGKLNIRNGILDSFEDVADGTNPFCPDNVLYVSNNKVVAKCLLVPCFTGEAADILQEFTVTFTVGGKQLQAEFNSDKENGVIIRRNTKSTVTINIGQGN